MNILYNESVDANPVFHEYAEVSTESAPPRPLIGPVLSGAYFNGEIFGRWPNVFITDDALPYGENPNIGCQAQDLLPYTLDEPTFIELR